MTVYENRYRRAFRRDRSLREMVLATVVMLVVCGLCALACVQDERDRRSLQDQTAWLYGMDQPQK